MSEYLTLQRESGYHAKNNPSFMCFDGSVEGPTQYSDPELRHIASEKYREMYQSAPDYYPDLRSHSQIPGAMGVHAVEVTSNRNDGSNEDDDSNRAEWSPMVNHVSIHSSLMRKPKKLDDADPGSFVAGYNIDSTNGQQSSNQTTTGKVFKRVSIHPQLELQLQNGETKRPRHRYDYKCAEVGLFSNHYNAHGEDAPPGRFYVVGPDMSDRGEPAYLAPCSGSGDRGYGCSDLYRVVGATEIGAWLPGHGDHMETQEDPSISVAEFNSMLTQRGEVVVNWDGTNE